MPEKIFKIGPFARFATEGLDEPSAAGVHGRTRAPEEMAAVDVGHGLFVAVRGTERQKPPG
jgi:hypothetical protein